MDKKDKAIRYNEGKPRWSLVDHESLEPMVRVLEFGEQKYGRWNWKKGLNKNEILESLYRHLIKLMAGEENDKETGLNHIGHIMSNAMFYSYFDRLEKEKIALNKQQQEKADLIFIKSLIKVMSEGE